MMKTFLGCSALFAAFLLAPAVALGAVFQFEALGASGDWVVIRENIPSAEVDAYACSYPGVDPSGHVGVKVHFVQLSAKAKSGRLTPLDSLKDTIMVHTPTRKGDTCTSAVEAQQRWNKIGARAKELGIDLPTSPPKPVMLGTAVPAKACDLAGGATLKPPCHRVFQRSINGNAVSIAVLLTAAPEAPDLRVCQFFGHRLSVAIQVSGFDFGIFEKSDHAPGGFMSHYDCRSQQFDALRFYQLKDFVVLLGSFRGTNIADRDEHPFLVIFPSRPAL